MVVLGTATEVGKTWMGTAVLSRLVAGGVAVSARKPVQSFSPGEGPTDAQLLAGATGERPQDVCPPDHSYEVAMAPPMAADVLGRELFTVAELAADLRWPEGPRLGWVETVGGPRSPLAADGDSADLAAALAPDLTVLVADAGLGAVNAVRLAAAALAAPPLVVLNRFEPTEVCVRNRAWLRADGFDVVTGPAELAARLGDDASKAVAWE